MIIAILLIIVPGFAWERVVSARRGVVSILLFYLLPLMILTSFGEGYGLVHYGKAQANYEFTHKATKFSKADAAAFEIVQGVGCLGIIFLSAVLVRKLGETFHGRHTYLQAFTAVAYGLGPMFLLRFLDMFPALFPWIPWLVGLLLSAGALYLGIPRIMQPDPPHAFGLYVMSCIMLMAFTGLFQVLTCSYLLGSDKILGPVITALSNLIPLK